VDDDQASRDLTAEMLKNAGHAVSAAASAREALARCKTAPPDLVLLDLILPDWTGVEVLQELRALQPELPVIIVTAYPEIRSAVEAMRRGAAEYLVKPVDPDALLAACSAALASRPGGPIAAAGPSASAAGATPPPAWVPAGPPKPLREVVTAYIDHVIAVTRGNKSRAARVLGISRETLRGKLAGRNASECRNGSSSRGASALPEAGPSRGETRLIVG